jgi:hypothetical protein
MILLIFRPGCPNQGSLFHVAKAATGFHRVQGTFLWAGKSTRHGRDIIGRSTGRRGATLINAESGRPG